MVAYVERLMNASKNPNVSRAAPDSHQKLDLIERLFAHSCITRAE